MYGAGGAGRPARDWALAAFAGSAVALILPAHVVDRAAGARRRRQRLGDPDRPVAPRDPPLADRSRRSGGGPLLATAVPLAATVAWGLAHRPRRRRQRTSRRSVVAVQRHGVRRWPSSSLGAGVFLAIAVAWLLARRDAPIEADLYLGTRALLVVGALVWGARLGDFNMFHLFFAGIAVFATPVAAVAVWSIWRRAARRAASGAGDRRPRPVRHPARARSRPRALPAAGLRAARYPSRSRTPSSPRSRHLPPDAKLAYACQPFEELAFWDSRLLGIDAHTGRRIVPMCFEADFFGQLLGARSARQRTPGSSGRRSGLYPDATARPSPAASRRSSRRTGSTTSTPMRPPNTLVPDAVPVASSAGFELLRLP